MRLRPPLPLLAAALLAGCFGPRASITSNRAAGANLQPRRVFVLSHLVDRRAGLNFGEELARAFEARAEEILRACGAEPASYRVTGIETDDDVVGKQVEAFRPDAVLRVQKTHGTASAGGYALVHADYDASLFQEVARPAGSQATEAKAKGARAADAMKTTWRAAINFKPGDHSFGLQSSTTDGQAFADEVFNQLKKDGFFPGCAPTRLEPAGGAPPPRTPT